MSGAEAARWTQDGHNWFFSVAGVENRNQISAIGAAVAASDPKPRGLIVSSDPYFRSFGPQLDGTLRKVAQFQGVICYPYQEYLDQDPAPDASNTAKSKKTPDLATDDPADQKTAYYQLGLQAAAVLNELVAHPATAIPKLNVKKWDGSAWQSVAL